MKKKNLVLLYSIATSFIISQYLIDMSVFNLKDFILRIIYYQLTWFVGLFLSKSFGKFINYYKDK